MSERRDEGRPLLRRLADHMGILPDYVDQSGGRVVHTSDATRERLLAAMGHDASTEAGAQRVLRGLRRAKRHEWIDPVRVVRQRSRAARRVIVRVPATTTPDVRWTLTLRTEEGIDSEWSGTIDGGPSRRVVLALHAVPPLGYHDLSVRFECPDQQVTGRQRLIVVPSQCMVPEARLHGRRGFGLTTNLYT
ncbi:MAG: hypothetical protein H0W68_12615, partial [Gemmatimonadaceae bacterium]|nr:hypothetical protein [Gemmatimonadaceae bacterium]